MRLTQLDYKFCFIYISICYCYFYLFSISCFFPFIYCFIIDCYFDVSFFWIYFIAFCSGDAFLAYSCFPWRSNSCDLLASYFFILLDSSILFNFYSSEIFFTIFFPIMLSSGAIEKITSGRFISNPLLQIISVDYVINDDSRHYCILSDGSNLIAPCVLPVLSGVTLVKDSIILLENYSFRFFDPLKQFLIDVSLYKLFPGVITQPASLVTLPVVAPSCVSPVNLQVSIPDVGCSSKSSISQSSLLVSADKTCPSSRPASLPSALVSPPFKSSSHRRTASMSDVSAGFVSASSLYSKRFKASSTGRIYLISELFSQSFWTINGRIIYKHPLRDLKNGKPWFFFVVNDMSGRIKINVFDQQCNNFYNLVQLHRVYTISRGKLVPAKAQYNDTGHPVEISLSDESHIMELDNFKDEDFPPVKYNFVKILALNDTPVDSEMDIVGVCTQSTLFYKGTRRSVLVMDDSLAEIRVSVWIYTPEEFNPSIGSILVIRRARMTHKSYGRLLTVSRFTSSIEIDPDIPEVKRLSEWYSIHGIPDKVFSLTKGIFGDISLVSNLPTSIQDDAVIYSNLDVSIDVLTGQVYQACSECSYKVKIYKRDIPVCEICQDTEPVLIDQLVLSFKVSDASGFTEIVAFTDVALVFLGKETVADLEDDLSSLLEIFVGKKFKFNIKTRKTIYHGQPGHIQHSIQSFSESLPLEE